GDDLVVDAVAFLDQLTTMQGSEEALLLCWSAPGLHHWADLGQDGRQLDGLVVEVVNQRPTFELDPEPEGDNRLVLVCGTVAEVCLGGGVGGQRSCVVVVLDLHPPQQVLEPRGQKIIMVIDKPDGLVE